MPMPLAVSMPHPHPHQHAPKGPPSNIQINTPIPLLMPAHSPFTSITPFTPGGAPFDPCRVVSPHPLLPPVTPIVPAFVKPLAASGKGGKNEAGAPTPKPVGFDESLFGGRKQGGSGGRRKRGGAWRRWMMNRGIRYPLRGGEGVEMVQGMEMRLGEQVAREMSFGGGLVWLESGRGVVLQARRVHGSTKRSSTRLDTHAGSCSSRSSFSC
ncbi:hypothetical protein CPC08DRAFT_770941 [Agrocybe pediades]|nr:hypothetical protein CPC08DRAFT_770941 [Agrocybe pediades]